jgi:hypothetical protein
LGAWLAGGAISGVERAVAGIVSGIAESRPLGSRRTTCGRGCRHSRARRRRASVAFGRLHGAILEAVPKRRNVDDGDALHLTQASGDRGQR